MKYTIFFLALALFAPAGPIYACCGGASWRQYEQPSLTHEFAKEVAGEYLKAKAIEGGFLYETARDVDVTVDSNVFGIGGNTYAAERLVAIICMYDNDYNYYINGNTSITPIGNRHNLAGHKICEIAEDCHLNYSEAVDAAQAALDCPHHECHWDYIGEQIPKYNTEDDHS